MNIEKVRQLTYKRIAATSSSQADYCRMILITPNNLSLFLNAKGAYKNSVPKVVLDDLSLVPKTTTTYVEKK